MKAAGEENINTAAAWNFLTSHSLKKKKSE